MELLCDQARAKQPLPKAAVSPDDLAEVVFTSGTTGDPKGTMLTHRNILSNSLAATQIFPIGPHQRLLSFIPLSHMFEQMAGFWCLLIAGASVVYPTSRQPSVVRRTFRERQVSMILITPAVVRSLFLAIERKAEQDGKGELFARLRRIARGLPMALRRMLFFQVHSQFGGEFRYIVSGGSALDPALGEAWRELGVEILQGYGLSECSPALTFNRLDRNRLGSVGVPLPGVEVRIAEDGEVIAHGPNIFKGYWENEAATRAALDADGWFHTGDLGKFDEDGFLWLHGRKKDMIALPDGLKVYPEDIENVFESMPVKEFCVFAANYLWPQRTMTGEQLVLVVHPDPDQNNNGAIGREVERRNQGLLPYKRVSGYVLWPEDFPRTASLKIKRNILAERIGRRLDRSAVQPL